MVPKFKISELVLKSIITQRYSLGMMYRDISYSLGIITEIKKEKELQFFCRDTFFHTEPKYKNVLKYKVVIFDTKDEYWSHGFDLFHMTDERFKKNIIKV